MQIVIPMAGAGARFVRAGYVTPKPLVEVDEKPMIAHTVAMFPGETDFTFICNRAQLERSDFQLAETIRQICPTGRIVSLEPHKKGPIWSVWQSRDHLSQSEPVVVNYCDFFALWDWGHFKRFVTDTQCDGAVAAYRGFHPHHLGPNRYAYIKESNGWLTDISEKVPYTAHPMEEYASSGTYYFRSGARCLEAMGAILARGESVNGEFYVSTAYKALVERSFSVAVYELEHFLQWGTPEDVEAYRTWSDAFRRLVDQPRSRARHTGAVLIPAAGAGARYSRQGYMTPKPWIPVSGRPMLLQAALDLPGAPVTRIVVRADAPIPDPTLGELEEALDGFSVVRVDGPTDGEATTCRLGLDGLDRAAPLTIGACDDGVIYDSKALEDLLGPSGPDVVVWITRGHPYARLFPDMFGWVDSDPQGRVLGVRVKVAPKDPATDPLIIGTFTFRRAGDFERCYDRLVGRRSRVNGEYSVDSVIEDVLALGLSCQIFPVHSYLGWGTPEELKTFRYWQSCFHRWSSHPYHLFKDSRVPSDAAEDLARSYETPAHPVGAAPARPVRETSWVVPISANSAQMYPPRPVST